MTASDGTPSARQIPVRFAKPGETIPDDYSQTPGGTIFSSTPRGSRIVYRSDQLLALSHSPLSQNAPSHMRSVPGVNAPLGYNFRARNVARPGAEGSADGLRPGSQSATLAHTMPASTGSTVTSSTAQPQTLQVPHNRGGRTDDGKSGSVLGSSVGSQQPGFRAPPNTPLNKTSIPSLGLNTLGGPDPIPKMMSMSLKEEDEDEEKDEADNETHGNDRDKHTGVFELEM